MTSQSLLRVGVERHEQSRTAALLNSTERKEMEGAFVCSMNISNPGPGWVCRAPAPVLPTTAELLHSRPVCWRVSRQSGVLEHHAQSSLLSFLGSVPGRSSRAADPGSGRSRRVNRPWSSGSRGTCRRGSPLPAGPGRVVARGRASSPRGGRCGTSVWDERGDGESERARHAMPSVFPPSLARRRRRALYY